MIETGIPGEESEDNGGPLNFFKCAACALEIEIGRTTGPWESMAQRSTTEQGEPQMTPIF